MNYGIWRWSVLGQKKKILDTPPPILFINIAEISMEEAIRYYRLPILLINRTGNFKGDDSPIFLPPVPLLHTGETAKVCTI